MFVKNFIDRCHCSSPPAPPSDPTANIGPSATGEALLFAAPSDMSAHEKDIFKILSRSFIDPSTFPKVTAIRIIELIAAQDLTDPDLPKTVQGMVTSLGTLAPEIVQGVVKAIINRLKVAEVQRATPLGCVCIRSCRRISFELILIRNSLHVLPLAISDGMRADQARRQNSGKQSERDSDLPSWPPSSSAKGATKPNPAYEGNDTTTPKPPGHLSTGYVVQPMAMCFGSS